MSNQEPKILKLKARCTHNKLTRIIHDVPLQRDYKVRIEVATTSEAQTKMYSNLIVHSEEMLKALKESQSKEYNAFEPNNQSGFYLYLGDLIAKASGAS